MALNPKKYTLAVQLLSPGVVGGKIVKIPPRGPAYRQIVGLMKDLARGG
jgi:hypothetical protein